MINFELMNKQLRALAGADASWLPVFANASALLWDCFPSINWAGFYIVIRAACCWGRSRAKSPAPASPSVKESAVQL